MEYSLPMHVYFCYQDDTVVFLDLETDEYTMIDGLGALAFRTLFCDVRDPLSGQEDGSCNPESRHADTGGILNELVENGLLTTTTTNGKPVLPTATSAPTEHLVCRDTAAVPVQAAHVWHFLVSCTVAALRLRFFHIATTVRAVQYRKARRADGEPFDFDKARRLVAVFNQLRRYFPAGYLCLFDSLALIEFLARYDVFPDWIFAVRPAFWGAHCWIQQDTVAFNEDTEEAEGYIPIMVV